MKNLSLLMLCGLFLSSATLGREWNTENESWSVQSSEKQFEDKSGVIYKASKYAQGNTLSSMPSPQLKTVANDTHKKMELAKMLTVRPEAKAFNQEFWIFDAWVEFYSDDDGDGYFNHFSVEFDADTGYSAAEVYARLYLGKDEVFREYHSTSNYNIFSDNSNDSFVVESELLNGFSSAEYEVLIELYDAYSDELVAVYDGNDDADLFLLSIESQEYETTQGIIVHEHGGSVGLLGLLLIPLLLMMRKYKKEVKLK
jgi:hypothetical protein